ncbi:MAG: (d)CMP kinase [Oscillospiraceae bacterium]
MFVSVAIDGPAGAGKSTISKIVAKKLNYLYVDTGSLYRTIAYVILNKGINPNEIQKVIQELSNINIEIKYIAGEQQVFLNHRNVSDFIRTSQISVAASVIAAIPDIRFFLLELQHKIAENNDVIMDGRDIGTVVLPNATVKLFLSASDEKRAERRYRQSCRRGEDIAYDVILSEIRQRDYNDRNRELAPLKQAENAILIDTSELSLEDSVQAVYAAIIANK